MSQTHSNVMLLGESEQQGFAPIVEFLRQRMDLASTRTATDLNGLRRFVGREDWHPDLIIVCQAWSEQFSEAEVHELIALCPLARIVCCFGPWCDSDGRTRSIWPLAVRAPIAAAAGRLARELALLQNAPAGRRSPPPLTASRAEVFEFDFMLPAARDERSLAVVVISPDRPWREMTESALRRDGFQIHDRQSAERPDAVVFDADPWDATRAAALRAIRAVDGEAHIVVAVGFPRRDLEIEALKAGAGAVWFKLAPLCELVDAVGRKIRPECRQQ
jgi:hypothetical protein